MSEHDNLDELEPLRAAIAEGQRLNLSAGQLFERAQLPVSKSTIYRWLAGEGNPGLKQFVATVRALEDFNAAERKRMLAAIAAPAPTPTISWEAPPPEWLA